MSTYYLRILIVLSLTLGVAYGQEDITALTAQCVGCHGPAGNSVNPQWPSIAGQSRQYFIEQMQKIRDGQRKSPLMAPIMAQITDTQIVVLADFYGALPAMIATTDNAADLVEIGKNTAAYCMPCHGIQGVPANTEWPRLAGQQATYIEQRLLEFKAGGNLIMTTILVDFNQDDFKALAAYYSVLKPDKPLPKHH